MQNFTLYLVLFEKIAFVVAAGLYLVFSFVIVKQVTMMARNVVDKFNNVLVVFSYIHLIFSLLLVLFTLFL